MQPELPLGLESEEERKKRNYGYSKVWRAKNIETVREWRRASYRRNREKILQKQRAEREAAGIPKRMVSSLTPEEKRKKLSAEALAYYYKIMADPVKAAEYKRKLSERSKRRYQEILADPERLAVYRAKQRERKKRHPTKYDAHALEVRHRWLARLRSDPERHKKYLEKYNALGRKSHHKLKNDPGYIARRTASRKKFFASEKSKEYQRKWVKQRRVADPQYKLYCALVQRVNAYLGRRNNRKGTVELLGCSIPELKAHLEKQFEPGMTWENHGKKIGQWSLDHIRPCASFNMMDPEQVNQCFHYTNLKPMWHVDNCAKNSRDGGKRWFREDHVQPALPPCNPAPSVAS